MIRKPLHDLVFIIADKASAKNIRADVPLVGTASYKNLLNWLADADIDVSRCRFFNQADAPFDGDAIRFLKNVKFIALGSAAAKYLNSTNVQDYFILPHPSPRNRAINDKKLLTNKLKQCKMYIYGKS